MLYLLFLIIFIEKITVKYNIKKLNILTKINKKNINFNGSKF